MSSRGALRNTPSFHGTVRDSIVFDPAGFPFSSREEQHAFGQSARLIATQLLATLVPS